MSYANKDGIENLDEQRKNYVMAFWHGSMLPIFFFHRYPKNSVSVLVSKSNDGDRIAALLKKWGYESVRGSSHRGGKEAREEMMEVVQQGHSLYITPDGPTGPRHEMKIGAIRLAQKTGVPLILAGVIIEKKKMLRSWDKFEIPLPFSKVKIQYSEPIHISSTATEEEMNKKLLDIQQQLLALSV